MTFVNEGYQQNNINMSTCVPKSPLTFKILAECTTSKARTSILSLPHQDVDTPVFMPVGTQVIINSTCSMIHW